MCRVRSLWRRAVPCVSCGARLPRYLQLSCRSLLAREVNCIMLHNCIVRSRQRVAIGARSVQGVDEARERRARSSDRSAGSYMSTRRHRIIE